MTDPLFLIALALLPLYFLLRRMEARPRPRVVSSLLLWDAVPDANDPRVREWERRTNWVLILELTAIASVVLGLAGPVVASKEVPAQERVVLIDRSASMAAAMAAGGRRWDHARDALVAHLRRLDPRDRVRLMGEGLGPADPRSRDEAIGILRTLEPLGRAADLRESLAAAQALARTLGPALPIVVSDHRPDGAAEWILRGALCDNAGIVSLCAGEAKAGGRLEILVGLLYAGSVEREVRVSVRGATTEGDPWARASVRMAAGEERRVLLTLERERVGAADALEVRLDPSDALAADDVAWLALPPPAPDVWRVGPENPDLDRALAAVFPGRVHRAADPAALPPATTGLLVYDRCGPERPPDGPCVVIAPARPLTGVFEVEGSPLRVEERRFPEGEAGLLRHAHLREAAIQVARRVRFTAPVRVLAESAGVPLVALVERVDGPLLYLGFDVSWQGETGESDWAQLPGFPIFFANLAGAWGLGAAAAPHVPVGVRAGEPVRLPPGRWTAGSGTGSGDWTPPEAGLHRLAAGTRSLFVAANLLSREETRCAGEVADPPPQGGRDPIGAERPAWRWPILAAIAALAGAWLLRN